MAVDLYQDEKQRRPLDVCPELEDLLASDN